MEIITDKNQWDKLEKPLIEIDDELSRIAEEKNLTIGKNHQNWPQRSLTWKTEDGLERKLEIVLEANLKTFLISGYSWYDDTEGQRFIKILNILKGIQIPLKTMLNDKLLLNIDLINNIKKEELKAGKI